MKWHKIGLIYRPSGDLWWARSYATLPTAVRVDDDVIRVYFAALDENRFGRIGYVDLDAGDPRRVLRETKEPVLDIGEPGLFDDCGVNPSCIVDFDGRKYLYYIGWQRCERIPYLLFAGLAVSHDGETFAKLRATAVLERTDREPYLRSATTIVRAGRLLRMWYVSGVGWIEAGGVKYPSYVIRHATSEDGVDWVADKPACIQFRDDDEFGFGRPWVVVDGPLYRMWYSIRSRSRPYRIGYAESTDGLNWVRKDNEAGISSSGDGWDAEMICYPSVVDAAGKRYMFYNGNRHGLTGFGCAVLDG